jgi:hypothetical protein
MERFTVPQVSPVDIKMAQLGLAVPDAVMPEPPRKPAKIANPNADHSLKEKKAVKAQKPRQAWGSNREKNHEKKQMQFGNIFLAGEGVDDDIDDDSFEAESASASKPSKMIPPKKGLKRARRNSTVQEEIDPSEAGTDAVAVGFMDEDASLQQTSTSLAPAVLPVGTASSSSDEIKSYAHLKGILGFHRGLALSPLSSQGLYSDELTVFARIVTPSSDAHAPRGLMSSSLSAPAAGAVMGSADGATSSSADVAGQALHCHRSPLPSLHELARQTSQGASPDDSLMTALLGGASRMNAPTAEFSHALAHVSASSSNSASIVNVNVEHQQDQKNALTTLSTHSPAAAPLQATGGYRSHKLSSSASADFESLAARFAALFSFFGNRVVVASLSDMQRQRIKQLILTGGDAVLMALEAAALDYIESLPEDKDASTRLIEAVASIYQLWYDVGRAYNVFV